MKKRSYSLYLIFLFLLFPLACKSPNSPELPTNYEDVVEFIYQRTKPVLDNNATGPNGFSIFNRAKGGQAVGVRYLGNNQWMAEASLWHTATSPYWIYTLDPKVTGGEYETVAETFYARIKGTSEWKELTCIGPGPIGTEG